MHFLEFYVIEITQCELKCFYSKEMLVTTYQLILQLMIIDLQFTTPAWRAVIPTTHLTFTALQKTLGFTPPPPILTPGSWLREGKLLREWPQQEAEERRVRTDWAQGVSSEVVAREGDVSGPPTRVDPGPHYATLRGSPGWCTLTLQQQSFLRKIQSLLRYFVINFPRTCLPHEGYSGHLITWP